MSKTPSARLFDLIHSMSQTEKRYFKINSVKKEGGESHQFLEMFDAISKMSVYDEEELKKQLEETGSSKHLAFRKSHLYDLILSTLRRYHKTKSPEFEVLNLLQDVKITFDRGLFEQAERLIIKLKKKCVDYNFHQHLVSVAYWEKRITGALVGKTVKRSTNYNTEQMVLQKLVAEQYSLLTYLRKENELWNLRAELIDMYRFEGGENERSIEDCKKSLDKVLELEPNNKHHFKLQIQTNVIKTLISYFEGDLNEGICSQKQVVDQLEENPKVIESDLDIYAAELNNLATFSFLINELETVLGCVKKLEKIMNKPEVKSNVFFSSRVFSFYQLNVLRYYNSQGDYKSSVDSFQKKRFEQSTRSMNRYKQFQIEYNVVLAYFFGGQLKEALKMINLIVNSPTKVRLKNLSFIRCLAYTIHYVSGNHSLLESIHASKDKTFLKDLRKNKSERILLTGLTNMILNPDKIKQIRADLLEEYSNEVDAASIFQKELIDFLENSI